MPSPDTGKKWVYLFREGTAEMRDMLGGKGAGLAEMTRANLKVPPGFTITTEACMAYYGADGQFPPGMWDQVLQGIIDVEKETGKAFGQPDNPLLVSVRSGATISMPGMMDSVLNLGLNRDTVRGLEKASGNERFAYDTYRRFIQIFARVVLNVPAESFERLLEEEKRKAGVATDSELAPKQLKDLVDQFLALVRRETGQAFPHDPSQQLQLAVKAVFASWHGRRAVDYRNFYHIPHDLGTAVNVVAMVFGNMDENSGTGVAFTRNPATGEKKLYGEYLANAQGEDVVAGTRTPAKIAELGRAMPSLYRQLEGIAQRLEKHYRDAQDMEFTVEGGTLYMLQTRSAKRTARAAVKIAVEMVTEGLISKEEALMRVEPSQIYQLLLPVFDEAAKTRVAAQGGLLAKGLNASPGAASGKVVFDPDRAAELGGQGTSVILVRMETNPDDVHGMLKARGILTARGGATSHAAVVARGLGKPCVAGCEALVVDQKARQCTLGGKVVRELEEISIDGTTGEVFLGKLPTQDPKFEDERELNTLLGWADQVKRLGAWANADTPDDAQRALDYGAQGIGLCRTEHMFFAEERLPIVRQMILAAPKAADLEDRLQQLERQREQSQAEQPRELEEQVKRQRALVEASSEVKRYHDALQRLFQFQAQDFKAILRIMDGKPVIIRLLDPPLHEFLPRYEDLLRLEIELAHEGAGAGEILKRNARLLWDVIELRLAGRAADAIEVVRLLLASVESLRESNPMLGLRGCRLGILYGAINEMQVRAIFTAACDLAKEGKDPRPEVMVPLVGHANELALVRETIEKVAEAVQQEKGIRVSHKTGTMIELPRAALTADQIAKHAEFFSFGTNDLTQMTYGLSRDDAEGKFLLHYIDRGILPENPFQVLDRDGVGALIKMAVERGRSTNPNLEVGICGEHGGDPSSISFCHEAGLNYVSASPFRVPVARLAAAQAALAASKATLKVPSSV